MGKILDLEKCIGKNYDVAKGKPVSPFFFAYSRTSMNKTMASPNIINPNFVKNKEIRPAKNSIKIKPYRAHIPKYSIFLYLVPRIKTALSFLSSTLDFRGNLVFIKLLLRRGSN